MELILSLLLESLFKAFLAKIEFQKQSDQFLAKNALKSGSKQKEDGLEPLFKTFLDKIGFQKQSDQFLSKNALKSGSKQKEDGLEPLSRHF